jgi:hypothetical protein
MLLEVEADQDMSNESNSLMDRVMAGVITTCSACFCMKFLYEILPHRLNYVSRKQSLR